MHNKTDSIYEVLPSLLYVLITCISSKTMQVRKQQNDQTSSVRQTEEGIACVWLLTNNKLDCRVVPSKKMFCTELNIEAFIRSTFVKEPHHRSCTAIVLQLSFR